MTETFDKALDQGKEEYLKLFKNGLRTIKKTEDRVSACNMVMMRARDIERENGRKDDHEFCFTISTYDPEHETWLRCPGCGDPEINKVSQNGNEWQGCYRCHVLLDKYGKIKSMKSQAQRKEKESSERKENQE